MRRGPSLSYVRRAGQSLSRLASLRRNCASESPAQLNAKAVGHRRQPMPHQICRRSQLSARVALSGCTGGVAARPAAGITASLTTRLHTP